MRDDRNMDAFDVVVAELFGDAVDSRELWDVVSKQGDASEVHVTTPAQKQARKKKIVNTVGQGLNALAIGAGTHALVMAGRDERLARSPARSARILSAPYKQWAKTGMHRKLVKLGGEAMIEGKAAKFAVPFAAGAVGLHTAELVGDSIAARALSDQRKEIKKALGDIVAARKAGRIDTETAVRMSSALMDAVAKVDTPDAREIHRAAEQLVDMSAVIPSKKVQMARETYQAGKKATQPLKGAMALVPKKKDPAIQPLAKSVKTEAGKIVLAGLKASGQEAQGVARAGAKAVGEEARTTVRAAGSEARSTFKTVGEESRKLPTSVDNTVNEVRGTVGDVRAGVNEARDAVKTGAASVSEAAGKVGGQIQGAADRVANTVNQTGDKLYRKGRKLALIGAGGVAGAATVPVGVAQLGANHRAKKYGVPIARAPQVRLKKVKVKKNDGPDLTWAGEIAKMDTDKRQVFGWCTVTHVNGEEVVDLQGDYIPLEEIEKAAYTYVVDSRKGGDMHSRDGELPLHTSDMVESFVVTPEKLSKMGLPQDALPHGWWVGFKVNDEKQWDMVKSGERTGFSIHGSGKRVEKNYVSKGHKEEAAVVGGAAVATAATPYWKRLPDDGGASERISESAKGGQASVADLRAIARGGGARAGNSAHTARIAVNMAESGFKTDEPVVVHRYKNGKMVLRGGHHRTQAAEWSGLEKVPVRIVDRPEKAPRTLVTLATDRFMTGHVRRARKPNAPRPIEDLRTEASKPQLKLAAKVNNAISHADEVLRVGRAVR